MGDGLKAHSFFKVDLLKRMLENSDDLLLIVFYESYESDEGLIFFTEGNIVDSGYS